MKKEKTAAERREEVATLLFCGGYLYCFGMLTRSEYNKVFNMIRDYQDKHEVDITVKQIDSVEIKYEDEP